MKLSATDLRERLLPILLAQATGLACGIIGVRLTSSLVAPADYGIYGVFVTLAPLGATVVFAGLVKFVSRHWQDCANRPQLVREVISAGGRKIVWLAAACAAVTAAMSPGQPWRYGAFLFASATLLTAMQLGQSALQASREHWRDLGVSAAASVSRSFAPPLLYAATGWGLAALLAGFSAHALVGALFAAGALRRWWRSTGGRAEPVLTTEYDGARFVVLAIAAWVVAGLYRWIVAWRFGSETAGYFTLATNVGGILPTMLGGMLLLFYQPQWFAAPIDTPEARRRVFDWIDRVAFGFSVLGSVAAVGVHLLMPLLIGPLVSERYVDASVFVLATGCAASAVMIGNYYHAGLIAVHRERACTHVDLSGAACLVVGALVGASLGLEWLTRWLIVSPLVPWLVNRTLARRASSGAS